MVKGSNPFGGATDKKGEIVMRFKYTPLAKDLPIEIKDKVRRRAIRHFEGQDVTHRVVSKDDSVIAFKFNRSSNKYPKIGQNFVVTLTKLGN